MTINDIAHYPWRQRWHRAPAGTEPLESGPQRQLDGRPSVHSNTQAHYDNTMLWVRWQACVSPVLIAYKYTASAHLVLWLGSFKLYFEFYCCFRLHLLKNNRRTWTSAARISSSPPLTTETVIYKPVALAHILNVDSNWLLGNHEYSELIRAPEVVRAILWLQWAYTGS